jgi:TetR/AcrR family transcriptional repressor of uid operon
VTPPEAEAQRDGLATGTRARLLDATLVVLARCGVKQLSMSDVAGQAGVSRPTLYRYFPSKDELLVAVAEHEDARFRAGMALAIRSAPAGDRLDAALRFLVAFQQGYGARHLIEVEPGFVIDRLARTLPAQRDSLARLIAERAPSRSRSDLSPTRTADLVIRVAISHWLIPGRDSADLLPSLRAVARLGALSP